MARLVSMRLAIILQAVRLADHAAVEDVGEAEDRLDLVLDHAADRNAGPVGDHRGDRLLVDMRVDHPLFRIDRLQRVELLAQLLARFLGIWRPPVRRRRCRLRGVRGLALGRLRFAVVGGLRISRRLRISSTSFCSVAHSGFERRELLLQRGDLGRRSRRCAPRRRRRGRCRLTSAGLLRLARGDRDARVLDHRRRRALADRDARAGGVEQAHRLVGQLPRRDVAVRELHRRHDRGIGDAHLVVLLHRAEDAAQHVAAARDVRLVDLDRLEAAGQRRVLLDILAVLRPGRRRDRAQRAARQRRLEQVGGVAGAGLRRRRRSACAPRR